MDGNQAASHVAYAYSDVAAIYPITPSSAMAESVDEWATEDRRNIFGQTVKVTEMQSEAGAAGAVHGSLAAGALTTTFTASQGLLLMIPNLYKIAGEMLPGVFHVAARTIATHALSIFGDHSDVYACRQTGAAMLASGSVQEVMDLAPVAHLAAIEGKAAFIHFFDGFRTSHEVQKIKVWDYEDLKEMADMDAIDAFRKNALNPNHAKLMGSAQNPDIYFQVREASNKHYQEIPQIVENYMNIINEKIGTNYGLFEYYGTPDAEHVIIAMGSVCDTIEETVDFLNAAGKKTGIIKVRLYRPFSYEHLLAAIPDTVKQITVLDRTKEPGAAGEPLYLDVVAALKDSSFHNTPVFSGRYGLSSKDTTPDQINAVYKNNTKQMFTVGINDDVTNLSLEVTEHINAAHEETVCCKFWGLGGDGTVSANKSSIKIIGDNTNQYVQAYFDYDSKKSMGLTISHLRFGTTPIRSTYLISQADFVACHNPAYLHKYNMVQDLKDGGTFLLNCSYSESELENHLPGQVKRYMAEHHIKFYTIDAISISKEIGLNNKTSTILQAAFFHLAKIIPIEDAVRLMKEFARKSYGKKGEAVVKMNNDAIDRGVQSVKEFTVKDSWLSAADTSFDDSPVEDCPGTCAFVKNLQRPISAQQGNALPVSAFLPYIDGATPPGTSAHERRDVATEVPVWIPENCIQCNLCSFVCPHAVIRPVAMTKEEKANAPEGMKSIPMMGMPELEFAVTVSEVDCTNCASCAGICPGRFGKKALEMQPVEEDHKEQPNFDYGKKLPAKPEIFAKFKESTVRGSQFHKPLLEFSGACAGCGETPYAKLLTQLFGTRMYIANATGCSSIWAHSLPSTPYTTNDKGQGPAWSNSLFEDAAEFGYGMLLAQKAVRSRLREQAEILMENTGDGQLKEAAAGWLETYGQGTANDIAATQFVDAVQKEMDSGNSNLTSLCSQLLAGKDFLAKKSQWIFGGDGWAYDIGFGGLDHVLASGEDINILVFDTEVYSNTGGQSSKSTPLGSTAKFASGGKAIKKKDLAGIAMTYGYVYVAQIAMGADYNQTIKALIEAENYPGPSLVIAYAPCISHGIQAGMANTKQEEQKAVKSGYWNLFRFNPLRKEQGLNPFTLDSKAPTISYEDFLLGEIRYNSLKRKSPEKAALLFAEAEEDSRKRWNYLNRLVALYEPEA